ncbi:copper chaperone PCu(A)C [Streptomyces sp. DSM 44915]|uniref:Copper chaperone PCu(A)C n=1 Tax=Streptomyces chisholmiae TaxID=3075540 RepID=A0ABU2JQA3_9ACTN|nr:copper chaperone PCu(A)C [Streptomyces sp. DSM 44915]MDT0267164.1 copper chaperone PCu(A)C [Streptomyces sp. DSM 44915]
MTRPRRARRAGLPALALAAATALLATGCGGADEAAADGPDAGGAPELSVTDAYLPEPVNPEVAGGFLTVHNAGDADDTLLSASSELAGTVEIHQTVDNAMRRVDGLPVPAGGELLLERGGAHLMFLDLTEAPVEGDTVSVELRFEVSEPLTVEVPVASATHTGADHDHGGDHSS